MNLISTEPNRIPVLDGIRGIAILLVLVYHIFPRISNILGMPILNIFSQPAYIGVDLFFVLSGYLITTILIESKSSQNYLHNFYIRRVLRIFPIYYLTLLIFLISASIPSIKNDALIPNILNQFWFWVYLQNWFFSITHTNAFSLGHFWSLAVEEHFYFVWPFVVLNINNYKTGIKTCLTGAICVMFIRIIGISFFDYYKIKQFLHFSTITRVDTLFLGALLAYSRKYYHDVENPFIKNANLISITNLALLLIICMRNPSDILWGNPLMQTIGYTSSGFLFMSIIAGCFNPQKKIIFIKQLFSLNILRFLGKYSYGIYIYHMPILILWLYFFDNKKGILPAFEYFTISCISIFVLAIISFEFFELKFIRLKNYFK